MEKKRGVWFVGGVGGADGELACAMEAAAGRGEGK